MNVSLASGLIESRYAVAARFSRIRSDGYRQNAFTDMYSYFLTATRFDSGMTTKLVVLGGPERTGLAYFGVPQQALETDRTQNDFGKFDTDNFNQPVYQLIHEWTVSPNMVVSNMLYHIKGDGFYTQQLFGDALSTYRLGNFKVSDSLLYPPDFYEQDASGALIKDAGGFYTITRSDVITKRSLDLSDYGWIPQLTWQHTRGRLLIGGELRLHTGRHFGELQSGNALPISTAPNQLYYDYDTYRTSGVFYLSENVQLTPEINLNADLRLQAMRYGVAADRFDQLKYSLNYFFVNPRVGININAAENLSIYASLGSVQREPTLSSFQFEGQLPLFKKVDPAQGIYEEPLLKPEQMLDAEIGAAWREKNWSIKAGVYGMDFQNELVFGGQLNDVGLPIYGNAERTRHLGFELDLALQTGVGLDFTGNLNVSQNTFVRYTEYGYDAAGNITAAVLDGKTIALNPSVIANVRAKYAYKNFYVSAAVQAVGRQYFDNTETPERSSDPYAVMNLNVSYRFENVFFSQAEVSAVINNVWDARYETSGVIDYFGSPRWFVGAPRNVFLTLRLSL
ncbi:MAG: TonB-dependent receptor [Rhizobacter sp.]|nr:TonB-dependent receptor [Chlorobiales bacterium]